MKDVRTLAVKGKLTGILSAIRELMQRTADTDASKEEKLAA
jgi:hypothetical protein